LTGKRIFNPGRIPAARLNEGEGGTEPRLGKSLAGLRFVTSLRFRQNGSAPARMYKTDLNFLHYLLYSHYDKVFHQ